jgi:transcriptional regulator with XRE-family HTH domain
MDEIDYFRIALKYYVQERGGQSNLSLDAHISEGYVSQIVSGKRVNPSRRTLTKIALALKTTYKDMITLGESLAAEQGNVKAAYANSEDVIFLKKYIAVLEDKINALEKEPQPKEASVPPSKQRRVPIQPPARGAR